jgi:hypothetical protein
MVVRQARQNDESQAEILAERQTAKREKKARPPEKPAPMPQDACEWLTGQIDTLSKTP